ncbi:hypothetical protein SDC9_123780 [bioreactor metagenome]|uniref:Uncharacterized protein n=1 Tax=bioreactor metagenome TaxID=1076179 RepID=A0A645CIK0_9ZZZZ
MVLSGKGERQCAGRFYPGEKREKARRSKAWHGDLHDLRDGERHAGGGDREAAEREVVWAEKMLKKEFRTSPREDRNSFFNWAAKRGTLSFRPRRKDNTASLYFFHMHPS